MMAVSAVIRHNGLNAWNLCGTGITAPLAQLGWMMGVVTSAYGLDRYRIGLFQLFQMGRVANG
jgi:hypothetical protein